MVNSSGLLPGEIFMTKSRAEQMVERLRSMQAAAPDIEASAIVSVDGLIMASALQQGVEEDRVSAMSAAMLSSVSGFLWSLDVQAWNRFTLRAIKVPSC